MGEIYLDKNLIMAFSFPAFCYIVALILAAFLIFFVIYHVNIE